MTALYVLGGFLAGFVVTTWRNRRHNRKQAALPWTDKPGGKA